MYREWCEDRPLDVFKERLHFDSENLHQQAYVKYDIIFLRNSRILHNFLSKIS